MTPDPKPPTSIAIATHPRMPQAEELASEAASFLEERGLHVLRASLYDDKLRAAVQLSEFDMFLALGGDGTMLRAGHLCAPARLPILGVNLGSLGFLIEVRRDGWQQAIERVLAGDYWLEERMMLRAEHLHAGKVAGAWEVLNECMVGRGAIVRPVRLSVDIDGRRLATYVADGVIVSTPTGSTAYAFAAGGPILPPELRNILIVPVAPHLAVDRAIVLHEGSTVRVTVNSDHEASLSVDGQTPIELEDGDQVEVFASEHVVHFVRLQDPDYFYRNLTSRLNHNPSAGTD